MNAEVYANAAGRIIGYRQSAEESRRFPPPATTTRTVSFDATTNQALLADLSAAQASYAIVAGPPLELRKNGVAVAINPPSQAYSDRALIAQLDDDIDALTNPLTLLQLQPVVRRGLRLMRYLLRRSRDL